MPEQGVVGYVSGYPCRTKTRNVGDRDTLLKSVLSPG
jgi:hypothetical protein